MVFRHFATKVELYAAILDHKACADGGLKDPGELIADAIERKDDRAVFETLAFEALQHHDRDPEFQRLLLYSALEEHELAQMFWERTVLQVYGLLSSYISERQRDGVFREINPLVAVRAFIGMIIHHSLNNNLWDKQRMLLNLSNEQAAREFTEILLTGIVIDSPKACKHLASCCQYQNKQEKEMIPLQKLRLLAFLIAMPAIGTFLVSCGKSKAEPNQAVDPATRPSLLSFRSQPRQPYRASCRAFLKRPEALPRTSRRMWLRTVAGKVVSIGVDLGSFVKQGSVLVRLDDRDARIRLQQAEAQVAQARSAVRQAEARIGLRSGQNFDPMRVAEVRNAQVALELAEKNLQRFQRLIESGDVSRSQYDAQKAQRDQLQQQYESQLAQAQQNFAAVQTARAAVDSAQSQVAAARKAIADAVVLAPMSGYVSDRPVALGEYVTTSSKIVTIVRTNPLRMKIDIPEQAIGQVQPGQSVSLSVSALPDRSFNGRVARVSPSVTATSRTLTVEAEVENGDSTLKPGQFATVRILLAESSPAVLVPARAVLTEGGSSRVFVIKNGRVDQRLVQLGQTEGDLIEIRSGVAADEPVATSNLEQLSDGVEVSQ